MIAFIAACSGVLTLFGFATYRNALGILGLAILLWCVVIELTRSVI